MKHKDISYTFHYDESKEAKECKFCGGDEVLTDLLVWSGGHISSAQFYVCLNCGALGIYQTHKEE
ncbi:hypothetical protein FACS1894187_25380 [Synergistales bacterium]|nr:hypothetical protein FACS1894187_25380 [Synergistales bacterium]